MTACILELTGTVVAGDRRGRTIGFATANLVPPGGDDSPEAGVYAALADGRPAAVNVGIRPTFAGATPGLVVEVHILDFEGDLYGQELRVTFLERLREERRFGTVAALVEQLRRDVEAVRARTAICVPHPG